MQKLKSEIRQKIIDAGKVRFKINGYENTSIKDIATDAGISIGNVYRYFLTKKHLLNEILNEIELQIEEFFDKIPLNYDATKIHTLYEKTCELTLKIAEQNRDTLQIMFNSQEEEQFIAFKEKILKMFTEKIVKITESINPKKEISYTLCEAIARAEFEGYIYIVKEYMENQEKLRENLGIYGKLMIENLDERVIKLMEE